MGHYSAGRASQQFMRGGDGERCEGLKRYTAGEPVTARCTAWFDASDMLDKNAAQHYTWPT